eukprot:11058205-Alexandrium_andersonii.AAC.1
MDPADRARKFLGVEVYGPVITPFPGVVSVDRSFSALSIGQVPLRELVLGQALRLPRPRRRR